MQTKQPAPSPNLPLSQQIEKSWSESSAILLSG